MPRDAVAITDLSARRGAQFAMLLPQRYLARVSSAALRTVADFDPATRKGHEWQRDAFTYNELIGEVGYLHNLTANLVSTCELRVVEVGYDSTTGAETMRESEDVAAQRVMRAFVGPQGGQKELKRRAALHYQIAGESYLLGTPLKDEFDAVHGVSWEFLSTEEVRIERNGQRQIVKRNSSGVSSDGGDAGFVDTDAYIARFWRPDPRYSLRADSPMKRVLPICRELVVLSEVVDSVAKSRLSSGLLFVPEELSFGPFDESEEESQNTDDIDRFIEALIDHMRAPVEDRTSAAGLVPLVVKGAAEFGKEIRLIPLAQDLDTTYQSLREELLKRLAQGLDAPPEVIGGKSGLNHWTSYNVDSDFISKHVNPVGEAIAEFVTVAYLRPMLVQYEGVDEAVVDRYRVVFDSRPITARSDEGPAAGQAWDRMALSDISYLRANGFSDEDYPTEEERSRRLLEKVILADPVNFGPTLLPLIYPELSTVFRPGSTGSDPDGGKAPTPEAVARPVGVAPETQPTAPPSGDAPAGASIEALMDRITVAADAALDRAIERASNRIISRANKDASLREQYRSVTLPEVLAMTDDKCLKHLGLTRADLTVDAWDGFVEKATPWLVEWLVSEGETAHVAVGIADNVMRDVARHLDDWLTTGLGRGLPVGNNGLRVPYALISDPLADAMYRHSRLV